MASKIPTHCRAGRVRNPGLQYSIEAIEDYPVPKPKSGELLLKLACSGLCMSDHHFMSGDWGLPMSCECSGHEGSGVVAALGPDVDPTEWKVGDRAGIKPIWDVCHVCEFCRHGDEVHCDKAVLTGGAQNGSYAQYVVTPARAAFVQYTSRVPKGVPDEVAAVIMCSGSTIYKALKASKAKPGQWVVIPGGGGGVGHQGIQYGKAMGLRIIAIDTGSDKEAMCKKLGAEAFIDFMTAGDVAEEVKKLTGSGAHAVVVTGGTAGAYKTAPSFLRKGGTQVCIGLPTAGTAMAGADPLDMVLKKLTLVGSLVGGMEDVDEALDFAARGLVKPIITVMPFKDFDKGVKQLVASKVAGRLVIDFNS